MWNLPAILTAHGPTLWLDTASTRVQAGWFERGETTWVKREGEAGEVLFDLLRELPGSVRDARSVIFCEGPGSTLGIRIAAAAIRTWQSLPRPQPLAVFSYQSLPLLAAVRGCPGDAFLCDARRQSWHLVDVDVDGAVSELRRVPTAEVTGHLHQPIGFRSWSALPQAPMTEVPYDLAALAADLPGEAALFHPCPEPEAYQVEAPQYATWLPAIHRAPASQTK